VTPDLQRPPLRPRKDVLFLIILAALAVLVALLWFADPSHRGEDKSRVPWPADQPGKP